jgi:hypothetical protein
MRERRQGRVVLHQEEVIPQPQSPRAACVGASWRARRLFVLAHPPHSLLGIVCEESCDQSHTANSACRLDFAELA